MYNWTYQMLKKIPLYFGWHSYARTTWSCQIWEQCEREWCVALLLHIWHMIPWVELIVYPSKLWDSLLLEDYYVLISLYKIAYRYKHVLLFIYLWTMLLMHFTLLILFLRYADLKNNRLTNYTFNYDQMLNDKVNVNIWFAGC